MNDVMVFHPGRRGAVVAAERYAVHRRARDQGGEVIELEADQSLMRTAQMTEEGILQAAQRQR